MKHNIIFQPGGIKVSADSGKTLKQVINEAGLNFDFPCGGRGKCGKCRVRITAGAGNPTEQEEALLGENEIRDGVRLACLASVGNDLTVGLLTEKNLQHQILLTSLERTAKVDPHITKRYIEADKPVMNDNRPDWQRVKDSLTAQGSNADSQPPVTVLRALPDMLRHAQYRLTAVI